MADTLTPAQRSRCMAAIRSKNTGPEMLVRRLVHRLGYRYRLHVRGLPGTPDMVLPRHRKIIEVRGCFWHGHHCGAFTLPATRRKFWKAKFERNLQRDRLNLRRLRRAGWRVLVLWECEVNREGKLLSKISRFLGSWARRSDPSPRLRRAQDQFSPSRGRVTQSAAQYR